MIDVKEAVQKAQAFVKDVIQDSRVNSTLLEEIEVSDDSKYWLVTISLPSPYRGGNPALSSLITGSASQVESRDYKLIRVDANTGDVESVKIRKI